MKMLNLINEDKLTEEEKKELYTLRTMESDTPL